MIRNVDIGQIFCSMKCRKLTFHNFQKVSRFFVIKSRPLSEIYVHTWLKFGKCNPTEIFVFKKLKGKKSLVNSYFLSFLTAFNKTHLIK